VVPLYFAKQRPVVQRGGWIRSMTTGASGAGWTPICARSVPDARLLSERSDRVEGATVAGSSPIAPGGRSERQGRLIDSDPTRRWSASSARAISDA
jgi:hypothetical protein